jgi:hypothetical protein
MIRKMNQTLAEKLTGASSIGRPLDTYVRVEAAIAQSTAEAILDDIENYLVETEDYLTTRSKINGLCYANGQTKNFSGKKSTGIHENCHLQLHSHWPNPETSFDESWAYGWTHWKTQDHKKALQFRNISLEMGLVHAQLTVKERCADVQDYKLLEEWNTKNPFSYQGDHWTNFINMVSNIRYYAFIYDTLEAFKHNKRKQKGILEESANICRRDGLRKGLEHLSQFTSFNPLFIDSEDLREFPQSREGQTIITLFPTDKKKKYSVKGSTSNGSLDISISSAYGGIIEELGEILQGWQETIETESGQKFIIK